MANPQYSSPLLRIYCIVYCRSSAMPIPELTAVVFPGVWPMCHWFRNVCHTPLQNLMLCVLTVIKSWEHVVLRPERGRRACGSTIISQQRSKRKCVTCGLSKQWAVAFTRCQWWSHLPAIKTGGSKLIYKHQMLCVSALRPAQHTRVKPEADKS